MQNYSQKRNKEDLGQQQRESERVMQEVQLQPVVWMKKIKFSFNSSPSFPRNESRKQTVLIEVSRVTCW